MKKVARSVIFALSLAVVATFAHVSYAADPTCPPGQQWQAVKGACVNSLTPVTTGGIPADKAVGNQVGTQNLTDQQNAQAKADAAAQAKAFAAAQGQKPSTAQSAPDASPTCDDLYFSGAQAFCKVVTGFRDNGILAPLYAILAGIAWIIWWIARLFLMVSGLILDNAMYWLVIHMGDFVRGQGSVGITLAWQAIRDLGNLAIIAGFVAVGISTIIHVEQYNANKFFTRLIIAALLINFSYFFAAAIIDASNFTSVAIMRSSLMSSGCTVHTTKTVAVGKQPAGDAGQYCSIYATVTRSLKLGTWQDIQAAAKQAPGGIPPDLQVFFIGIFAAIFFFCAGYIFFSAAILLIGRFVALILLIIASPIGIAGGNIPIIDGYASKWWDALWGQALFAPAYFLLVAIGLNIFKGFLTFMQTTGVNYGGLFSGTFTTAVAVIPLVISFVIGIGFMYAALSVAKSMSEAGHEYFGDINKMIGNTLSRTALGWPSFLASSAYDNTIARAVNRIPLVGGAIDRGISSTLRIPQNLKPLGSSSAADRQKENRGNADARRKELGIQPTQPTSKAAQAYQKEMMDLLAASKKRDLTPEEEDRLRELVSRSPIFSKENLGKMDYATLEKSGVLKYLNTEQADAVFKSQNLTQEQRDKASAIYYKKLNGLIDGAKTSGKPEDWKKVDEELERLGTNGRKLLFETRRDLHTDEQVVKILRGAHFEDLKKSLPEGKAAQLAATRKKVVNQELTSGDEARVKAMANRLSADEGSKLDLNIMLDPVVLRALKSSHIKKRFDEEEIADNKSKILEKLIEAHSEGHTKEHGIKMANLILGSTNPRDIATGNNTGTSNNQQPRVPTQPSNPTAPVPPPAPAAPRVPPPQPEPPTPPQPNTNVSPGPDVNKIQ